MRKFFRGTILALIFLNLLYCEGYSLDDREKFGSQPVQIQPPQVQNPQPYQNQQMPARPMLPPVVSSPPLGISPTPSPHIAAPSIMPATIAAPSLPAASQPATIMQANFQSSPAQVELPQVPIIGNSLGKVIDIGAEKDGLPWIEVEDELFGGTLKIKINPKNTPVIKKGTTLNFKDIKIGDTVNVIFNQQDEDITANFISILTEEDLKIMEESLKSNSNLETENEAKDDTTPAAE